MHEYHTFSCIAPAMKKPIYASLLGAGDGDAIFSNEETSNRDFVNDPYIALRSRLGSYGIELHTADQFRRAKPSIEIHLNAVQQEEALAIRRYLIAAECREIWPANFNSEVIKRYRKVFTWSDDLIGREPFVKFQFGHRFFVPQISGFENRPRLCCLIAGNKALTEATSADLYQERVRIIRWFERHAPSEFDLYGTGWNAPPKRTGVVWSRVHRACCVLFSQKSRFFFPSYQGRVDSKNKTYARYKFAICYENVGGSEGYITEKIFDAFFAGCVPVYLGAPNVTTYIPANCFLDRRNFGGHEDLYQFMKHMKESEYLRHQQAIVDFLTSEQAERFTIDAFASTIADAIIDDLRGLGVAF